MEWVFTPPLFGVLGATTAPDWQTIGSMLVGVLGLLGVLYTGTRSRASSREANAVTFSKTLLDRIETLEDDIKELKEGQQKTASILSVWTVFTENLFRWGRGGGGEPEPSIPAQLREQLAHLIHDHQEH